MPRGRGKGDRRATGQAGWESQGIAQYAEQSHGLLDKPTLGWFEREKGRPCVLVNEPFVEPARHATHQPCHLAPACTRSFACVPFPQPTFTASRAICALLGPRSDALQMWREEPRVPICGRRRHASEKWGSVRPSQYQARAAAAQIQSKYCAFTRWPYRIARSAWRCKRTSAIIKNTHQACC